MSHEFSRSASVLTLLCLTQTACGGCQPKELSPEPTEDPGQVLASGAPRVKFKGPTRWGALLSRGLELDTSSLCKEFGKYDCLREVHHITLGGVEPYRMGLHTPLPTPPITAPLAADRVALSACTTRATRDASDPELAVMFPELSDAQGGDLGAIRAMSSRLYERLLGRRARATEIDALVTYWEADTSDAQRWAIMSCYALATSVEALFY